MPEGSEPGLTWPVSCFMKLLQKRPRLSVALSVIRKFAVLKMLGSLYAESAEYINRIIEKGTECLPAIYHHHLFFIFKIQFLS